MRLTRKQALAGIGAAAFGAAAAGRELPLHTWYDEVTGACGPAGPAPPRRPGTRVVLGELHSHHVTEPVGYAVGLPPGHMGTAAAVCLPGRGSDARWVVDTLHVVDFVAAAGLRYAVAAVDGGESYWHRRASGEDRMRMLFDEFLPLLERRLRPAPAGRDGLVDGWVRRAACGRAPPGALPGRGGLERGDLADLRAAARGRRRRVRRRRRLRPE